MADRVVHFVASISNYRRWLVLSALGIMVALAPIPMRTPAPIERFFRVEAASYEYSPAMLRANPGDRITIQLVSQDVVHGIHVDGYGVEVQADPGQPQSLTFTAVLPGTYRIRCSVTCGALHPFMIGKLQVGPNLLLWRGAALALLGVLGGAWSLRR